MKKIALIALAEGFEEIETVVPADILRRAEVEVVIAGLGKTLIKGSRDVTIKADTKLENINFVPDAVIFPGGMPGAENLASSPKVAELIKSVNSEGKLIAAICASPALVLAPLGILDGKKATCYPGMEEKFPPLVKLASDAVVQDGNIITASGPATAFLFALKIAEWLVGKKAAETVRKAVLFS